MNQSAENIRQKLLASLKEKGSITTPECRSNIIQAHNQRGSKQRFAQYSQKHDEYKEVM